MGFKSIGNKKFDKSFEEINNLQYYPFIGQQFNEANERILIVGESHYADNLEWIKIELNKKAD